MSFDVLTTVLVSIITAALGLITTLLSKRYSKIETSETKKVEEIVSAASARAEEHRARALELLAEKLPKTDSVPELVAALERMTFRRMDAEHIIPTEFIRTLESQDTKSDSTLSFIQDLVDSYHRQALEQAKVQFWFSIVAATIGFLLVVYMVTTSHDLPQLQLLLKSLPGVAITTVAGLFFKQAGETRQRATELYDRLRSDNQHSQAISLVESIEDGGVRSVVKAQLALHMAGLAPSTLDLSAVLSDLTRTNAQKDA